ncbi:hypothetical protein GFS31_19460 [Leptolyngbya sp. BL0902]|uniref:low-complexity tail membrane protein n=1 Tax=Leptolyngbya sp. BL0902 TaxID=1115757 RepID=UPI0018E8EDD5|nr:low-complexity tail membrane protein [Leptolyngbya sp. BL0902]QQE65260.1 hypothetical protein GFS31_19460 [Leptolyngbya sp. BL0902]
MATHRYDPYLWVHLAGLATVPLWLAISMLGLAVGSPQWPGLELALLALLGVSPALWMQLRRPFYIFSLLALTLKPTALSDDQRRMLTIFQQWWVRSLAIVSPILLVWLLWEIYPRAVVAADITPFASLGHFGGLAVAAGSFALANLFLQVPVSVLAVMATSEKRFKRTTPYSLDQVKANFTQVGIPLKRLLPEVLPPEGAVSAVEASVEQALVAQESGAVDLEEIVDLEPAVGPELVEVELAETALAKVAIDTPEITFSPGPDATAFEPEMDEAQVWADSLQPSTELAANDEALPESPEPVTLEVAESATISLNDAMDRLDGADSFSGDNATNDLTTVEATVEDADNLEVNDLPVEVVEEIGIKTNEITVEVSGEVTDLEVNDLPVEAVEEIDLESNDTIVEVAAEETVETVESIAEVSVSEPQAESQSSEDWDHGNDGWDQTTHDWEQDPNWEASVESAKEQTVEVAVVRISDPS